MSLCDWILLVCHVGCSAASHPSFSNICLLIQHSFNRCYKTRPHNTQGIWELSEEHTKQANKHIAKRLDGYNTMGTMRSLWVPTEAVRTKTVEFLCVDRHLILAASEMSSVAEWTNSKAWYSVIWPDVFFHWYYYLNSIEISFNFSLCS